MFLNKLSINNFQLFSKSEICFDKTNLIIGFNYDAENTPGNAAGKSTILSAIQFVIYGGVSDLNLSDLLRQETKSAIVEAEFTMSIGRVKIVRKIPSSVQIFVNDIEKQFNTASIAQKYLDELFGDYNYFKLYRMLDNKKGINLLDLGSTSLRKNLIQFVDDYFSKVRLSLLEKINNMEKYSIDKRLYRFHLSEKRLSILKGGLNNLKTIIVSSEGLINKLNETISAMDLAKSREELIYKNNINEKEKLQEKIIRIETQNKEYDVKIKSFQNIEQKFEEIDYDTEIDNLNYDLNTNKINSSDKEKQIEITRKLKEEANNTLRDINSKLENIDEKEKIIKKDIDGLQEVKIGTRCDKCGSIVSEQERVSYLNGKNKELEVLIKEEIKSEETLSKAKIALGIVTKKLDELLKERMDLTNEANGLDSKIQEYTQLKIEQQKKINKIEQETIKIESDRNHFKELINNNLNEIEKIREELKNISGLSKDDMLNKINVINLDLEETNKELSIYKEQLRLLESKNKRTESYIMKLEEAFKFIEYKYTKADIQAYTDSIKTLDLFTASYIQDWLSNLSTILNDLLKGMNISVEFSSDKDFIKVTDNGQEFKYNQLSSGQKVFLNGVFKTAILLNNGITNGIILIDEGMNELHPINMAKFVEILKNLQFQVFIIYQNIDTTIQDVKYITVERRGGISNAS